MGLNSEMVVDVEGWTRNLSTFEDFVMNFFNLSEEVLKMAGAGNSSGTAAGDEMPPEIVHQIALISAFMVIALMGNLSVLTHLIGIQGWRRPVTIFIMSLALSDVLIALLSMTTEILWEAFGEWIFGNIACKLATYIQCLLFVSTALILMNMSYDRYVAICQPMTFTRTPRRIRGMILISWALAMIMALPQIFIFVQVIDGTHSDGTPKHSCKSRGYTAEWQRKLYVTWIAALVFLIPLAFIAFCYINIAIVVSRRNRPNPSADANIGLRRNNSQGTTGKLERKKVRTIQLTICILAGYILCWTPYFTMNLLNVWTDYRYQNRIPSFLRSLAKCLAWFSSCVNPLIYGGFHLRISAWSKLIRPEKFGQAKCTPSVSGSGGKRSRKLRQYSWGRFGGTVVANWRTSGTGSCVSSNLASDLRIGTDLVACSDENDSCTAPSERGERKFTGDGVWL